MLFLLFIFFFLFIQSGKKEFFWLQDAKDDKDIENITKINKFLNPQSASTTVTNAPSTTNVPSRMYSTSETITPISNQTQTQTTDTLQRLLATIPVPPPNEQQQHHQSQQSEKEIQLPQVSLFCFCFCFCFCFSFFFFSYTLIPNKHQKKKNELN